MIRFLDFEIDLDLFELRRTGRKIDIGARPLDTLLYLIRRRDQIVSKQQLRQDVWGPIPRHKQHVVVGADVFLRSISRQTE